LKKIKNRKKKYKKNVLTGKRKIEIKKKLEKEGNYFLILCFEICYLFWWLMFLLSLKKKKIIIKNNVIII